MRINMFTYNDKTYMHDNITYFSWFIIDISGDNEITVCEGENLDIRCEADHVVVIKSVVIKSYGRSSTELCGGGSGGEPCSEPEVIGKMAICYQVETCQISADAIRQMFSDTQWCSHRNPYLQVNYDCVAGQ